MKEIQLELDNAATEALSQLQGSTGMSQSDIFSYALSLMVWAVKQKKERRVVASVDESKRSYRELQIKTGARERKQNNRVA